MEDLQRVAVVYVVGVSFDVGGVDFSFAVIGVLIGWGAVDD